MLRELLEAWAHEQGFQAVGVTDVSLETYVSRLDGWLSQGYQADMTWMSERRDMRARPDTLLEGTARVVSLRMDYRPPDTHPLRVLKSGSKAYISRYALGRDYHKTLRTRLARIAARMETWANTHLGAPHRQRAFVDSAPVLEKPLAEKAGLGWIGKNTLLLNRTAGSWFFLGEILTSIPLPADSQKAEDECGTCRTCLTICPTGAFPEPYVLDANKCISYLTIENRDSIPPELRSRMGNRVFGCDDCQLVCPWNRYAKFSQETDFRPRHGLEDSELIALYGWTREEFLNRTTGSPIRRTGYSGWRRNLAVAIGNGPPTPAALKCLEEDTTDDSMVREHVEWALAQLRRKQSQPEDT